jgi:hypothetical protein
VCDLLQRGTNHQQQQQQQQQDANAASSSSPAPSAAAAVDSSSNSRHTLSLQQLARLLSKDGAEPSHDGLGRLLDAAVSLQLLGGSREGYYLTDLAHTHLTRDSQHSLVGYIIHSGEQGRVSIGRRKYQKMAGAIVICGVRCARRYIIHSDDHGRCCCEVVGEVGIWQGLPGCLVCGVQWLRLGRQQKLADYYQYCSRQQAAGSSSPYWPVYLCSRGKTEQSEQVSDVDVLSRLLSANASHVCCAHHTCYTFIMPEIRCFTSCGVTWRQQSPPASHTFPPPYNTPLTLCECCRLAALQAVG